MNRHGQMELSTLENGVKIELMERVDSFMLMETFTMDNGLMIKLMATESTNMSMALNMKENGKMTYNMEKV